MPDLDFQNFSTVQSNLQPTPTTIVGTATIAPTTLITVLTGTVVTATITPPLTGAHMLVLIYVSGTATTVVGSNIANAVVPAANTPVLAFYNPVTKKYYLK